MAEIMDAFWQQPPVARTLAAGVFTISVLCYSGIVPFGWFHFEPQLLLRMPPQIWRLVTGFMMTSPKLSIVMDPYFLFSYLKQIEVGNPRFPRREDMIWYLVCIASFIMIFNRFILGQFGGSLQALIIALAYTCTQDQRGIKANFFFITIPAQLVPYAMILADTIMVGPFMVLLLVSGILAAHLYDFLARLWPEFGRGFSLLKTPAFMSRLVDAPFQRVQQRGYGQAYQGTGRTAGAAASGSSGSGSGPLPDAWRTRGKGQRLGD
ncbi:der1-like family protein [Ophiostoma piceae UAMH 11346]|uniref:Derlin n=1 Tax=Ophiostoma piceae (strain UAMH 11346) TaxID=1262450 RepID=S3CQL9_OPHP1|nr:der1-like family protein [Ophiostoma piceae UAMH 11346]